MRNNFISVHNDDSKIPKNQKERIYSTDWTLKENFYNPHEVPVFLIQMPATESDTNPFLHYSDFCEIMILQDVPSEIYIANKVFYNNDSTVFIIPSPILHGLKRLKAQGIVIGLHVDFKRLEKFINLKAIFNWEDYSFNGLPLQLDICDEILPHINSLAKNSNDVSNNIRDIISIFNSINNGFKSTETPAINIDIAKNDDLKKLIIWTHEHFCEKISIEEAAEIMHFNKFHFCKYFKQAMGTSYINYVNQLKIQYSIKLLKDGKSATECCMLCGFDSISYFIQLFKKITGFTTKEYIKKVQEEIKK